jgi:hypothetical protein
MVWCLVYLGPNPTDTIGCPPNDCVVALVVAPGVDYHWYRHNPDGTWSGKAGATPANNVDASGIVIYDPRTANRNYGYLNYFLGRVLCRSATDEGVAMNKQHVWCCALLIIVICSCKQRHAMSSSEAPSSQPVASRSTATNPTTHMSRHRTLDELRLTAELTRDQVAALWGPPDGDRGSGVQYLAYVLEDGEELWLEFLSMPPHRLHGAVLYSPESGKHRVLFSG